MEEELNFGKIFKKLNKIFEKTFNKRLEQIELTHSQLDILIYLFFKQKAEINQRDIEKQFNLKNPTVTGLLNRLESKGFIKRVSNLKDARLKRIVLTPKAINLAKDMKIHKNNMEKKITKDISKEDIRIAYNVLIKMINNIEEEC